MKKPFDLHADYQPESFVFYDMTAVDEIIARYPKGRERSAVMPLLDLAQRQVAEDGVKLVPPVGGWIPRAAMDEVARILNMPAIKVYEVATFYSMYNLAPVGKFLIQFCGTTPCWLRGAHQIIEAAEKHLGIHVGESTQDGLFSLMEVECLGACVNAPMIQINDHYYEDLTPERMVEMLKELADGGELPKGSQIGRKCSMACSGPTTLTDQAKKCGVV